MRRMIMSALVLIPVLANAQSNVQSSPTSRTATAGSANMLIASADSSAGALSTSAAALPAPAVRQTVREHAVADFTEAALNEGGTLSYTMGGIPSEVSEPKLIRAVELSLSAGDLTAQPEVSTVAVKLTVDSQGIPRNLFIAKSAGAVIDSKAIAAISQYRFAPATRDNLAVPGTATVSVSIRK